MPTLDERIEAAQAIEPPHGQWFAAQPDHTNGWWVISTDPEGNDTVDESSDGGFEEETARFISAAPDLHRLALDLAAERERLRTALSDFVAMGEQYGWGEALTGRNLLMKQARAALASEPRE